MGNVPVLKPREVVAILEGLGFAEVRQKGSHKQFRHADGRCTTVPFHSGRDISPILLRQIGKDVEKHKGVTPTLLTQLWYDGGELTVGEEARLRTEARRWLARFGSSTLGPSAK